jgi:hypothetical protein
VRRPLLLRSLLDSVTPWSWRLLRYGQVCEMALMHVNFSCKVSVRRLLDGRRKAMLVQVESPEPLPSELALEVRSYLVRKLNAVMGTRLKIDQLHLAPVPSAAAPSERVPYVSSEMLSARLASARSRRPALVYPPSQGGRPQPGFTGSQRSGNGRAGADDGAQRGPTVHPVDAAHDDADHMELVSVFGDPSAVEVLEFSASDGFQGFSKTVPSGNERFGSPR